MDFKFHMGRANEEKSEAMNKEQHSYKQVVLRQQSLDHPASDGWVFPESMMNVELLQKRRVYKPWTYALITKLFGPSLGYKYFLKKIKALTYVTILPILN